jgi:hypothetical protein
VPYFPETARQIVAQRPRWRCAVFSNDPTEVEPPGWRVEVIPRESVNGNGHPYRKILVAAQDDEEGLILFEDDVQLSAGAVPYMEDFPVPADLSMVSFCQCLIRHASPWGLYRAPGWSMRMTQCCKFSRAGIATVLAGWSEEESKSMNMGMSDAGIAFALGRSKLRWGMHVPDLAAHVGEVSTLTVGLPVDANRRCNNFHGANFDAVVLREHWASGIYD